MSSSPSVSAQQQSAIAPSRRSILKRIAWIAYGLLALSAFLFTSVPILQPTNPMHDLLYSQRWLLFPHIAGALTVLILGPLQFSRTLRQRNPARHRLLGKCYIAGVLVATIPAVLMARHYPAFLPYSVTINAFLWLTNTAAAFLAARNGRFEQHRRWMARSYAMTATFVVPRIPLPFAVYNDMSLEAGSYFLLAVAIVALLIADLIVDWEAITARRLRRGVA
ncbi:MAG: DUF2306 domain-containing protein [Proteobacteria bacterium]|nr:DUF2306 domain-containing protein [Pseudomonadota bacterium]